MPEKKRASNEAQAQAMFFTWLTLAHPSVRKCTFAIANGGSRNVAEASNLKRQGVTAGVSDVFMSVPMNGYHGLYIEFKHGKNKLTDAQAKFQHHAGNYGYMVSVCYSFDEARTIVEDYLSEER